MNEMSYKGIYGMHKYWGKKPFNEISKFIDMYSAEGETVLDCFCGSGVTLIEALRMNRRCIGIDLNPIAIFLSKVSLTTVDKKELLVEYNKLQDALKDMIMGLYKIGDGEDSEIVTHVIWKNGEPIEVWYSTKEKKKTIREGHQIDVEMAFSPKEPPKWYPENIMFENSRINVAKEERVSDLFTPRAIVGLSHLLDYIYAIENEKIRNVLLITFSGTLSQASNLVFVIRGRKKNGIVQNRAEVGSWVIGYWMPEEHFEINVWNCFENRFKRVLKGIDEINLTFGEEPDDYFEKNVELYNQSATEMPIEDNCVDYVFIDPPHANRILYMEQSLMWNSWLRMGDNIDWENEIIVSEAKDSRKTPEHYNQLLDCSFAEIHRVLKPGRSFSMAFNCFSDDIWKDTLNLFIKHGFVLEDIVPLEYSATSVVQDNRKNALKTDFVLTFKNSGNYEQDDIYYDLDDEKLKRFISELIENNPQIEIYEIINSLFKKSLSQGYIFKISSIVKIAASKLDKK